MSELFKILVVNPGSTSTKLGLFENEKLIAEKKIAHSSEEISQYPNIMYQLSFRRKVMDEFLAENNVPAGNLSAVVGRGGLLKPLLSGTYRVNEAMVTDLKSGHYGEHASNIGGVLAYSFDKDFNIPAFIVDPVVVDEMQECARYSGIKEIPRRSVWHALNVMAVTRQLCENEKLDRHNENFIVAHIGGGISISAIEKGRCIDVSNGLSEGPFTPERAGSLPTCELVDLCFSGKYSRAEIKKLLVGQGGLVNYLGTSALPEVQQRIENGDSESQSVLHAMAYQIAKTIGSMLVVLKNNVNRVILTGGGAHNETLTGKVSEYIRPFAAIKIIPGEDELSALALGGLRVLRKKSEPKSYQS